MFSSFHYKKGMTSIHDMREAHMGNGTYSVYSKITRLNKPSDFIAFADKGEWHFGLLIGVRLSA